MSVTFRSLFCRRAIVGGALFVALLVCLGCGPSDPVEEAKAYIDQGRLRVAIEVLEPVVRQERDNYDAQFYYGLALTLSGEGGPAEWSLRRAMKDPKHREAAARMIVGNAIQGNNAAEAVKILTDLLEDEPDSIALLLARAMSYAKTRVNLDEVLADVARIRELDPANLNAFRPEIVAYLSAVMTEEAAASLAALGERLEEDPDNEGMASWYCTTMALFAMESGEKELARERFEACVETHPTDVAVVREAAGFYQRENQTDRAIEILTAGMKDEQVPTDPGLVRMLAGLLVSAGRSDDAETLLRGAAGSENLRTAIGYTVQLASLYESQGRLDAALDEYEAVLELSESVGMPTQTHEFRLADLAIRAGRLDRALAVASKLEHRPFRLMIQARVAQEREEHAKAISLYKEVSRTWPDNEYARYHAARSAEQIGDFEAATELYRHATRISTDTTNAMTRIALLQYASDRPTEALEVLSIQGQRASLDEAGELLKVELMVLAGGVNRIPAYLSRLPASDAIGIAPRLASVFRGLRLKRQFGAAIELVNRVDPRVWAQPGADIALEELIRLLVAGSLEQEFDRVSAILDAVPVPQRDTAGLLAVRGVLGEARGASAEVIASAYESALEVDPDLPMALLGRARALVREDKAQALEYGLRALASDSVDTERVTELAVLLLQADARPEAMRLSAGVLKRTPFDGTAAQILAQARLASGDHSDRSLDFARRAARFARSEQTLMLLRDMYAARGQQEQADAITQRLKQRESEKQSESDPDPSDTDAA